MKMNQTLVAQNRQEWRAWLEQHYQSESEVWLIFSKSHTGQACVSYDDSVEEALCFGWIDSIIQKIDEDRYARKFTPRRLGSEWSPSNKRRIAKLIQEGRMTKFGLAVVTYPHPELKPSEAELAPRRESV